MGCLPVEKKENGPKIIQFLKEISLEKVMEFKKIFYQEHPEKNRLSIEEFNEIFSEMFDHTEELAEILKSRLNKIDVYDSFAALYVFCKGKYKDKIKGIFDLFDFDGSGDIDSAEMIVAIQSAIVATAKIYNLKVPPLKEIRLVAEKIFKKADIDNSETITIEEFTKLMIEDEDIQNFLAMFMDFQTQAHAKRLFYILFDKFYDIFIKFIISGKIGTNGLLNSKSQNQNIASSSVKIPSPSELRGKQNVNFPELNALSSPIEQELKATGNFSIEELSTIMTMLDPSKCGYINLTRYFVLMKVIASYFAVDLNRDHTLQNQEIRTLLWLIDNEEPSEERVKKVILEMDSNNDGTVQLIEWCKYLGFLEKITGNFEVDVKINQLFSIYDENKTGEINKNIMIKILEETLITGDSSDEFPVETSKQIIKTVLNNEIEDSKIVEGGFANWTGFKKIVMKVATKLSREFGKLKIKA